MRADLLGNDERLFVGYGLHLSCAEGVCGRFIVSQVKLGTDKDNRDVGGMVFDFRKPLGFDVIERRRADDGETDKEDICLRVGQRSETVVILLAGGIPQTQANRSTIHHHTRGVVIENGWDVFPGEGVGCVGDQEACLANSTITGNYTLQ